MQCAGDVIAYQSRATHLCEGFGDKPFNQSSPACAQTLPTARMGQGDDRQRANIMLSKLKRTALGAATCLTLGAQGAFALPPLADDKYSDAWILAGYVGDKIANNCDAIYARKIFAIRKLYALRDRAVKMGYSSDEVKAYFDDRKVRANYERRSREYLAANGVTSGDKASYCTLGEAELAKDSLVGQLIGKR